MKTVTAILSLLMLSSVASAQSPDPSKLMCRNISESGGFVYQGETIFGSQACRPIQQAVLQPVAATAPRPDVGFTASAIPNTAPTDATPAPISAPTPKINDGKTRLYVTDEPKDESIFIASHHSGWQVNGHSSGQVSGSFVNGTGSVSGSSNGYVNGSGGSAGAAYSYSQKGADPRTVEIQADLYKRCPSIVVTDDPARADYALLFRREGGKRSSMFAFGGLTGLALSAHSKVDGASVFDTNGDMVFATRARTVETAIKEVCGHVK
jgi:hypothetical protein